MLQMSVFVNSIVNLTMSFLKLAHVDTLRVNAISS